MLVGVGVGVLVGVVVLVGVGVALADGSGVLVGAAVGVFVGLVSDANGAAVTVSDAGPGPLAFAARIRS